MNPSARIGDLEAAEDMGAAPLRFAHPALTLGVLVAWQAMLILDGTIVNIALTSIQASLGFSETGLSWVVNAYALAFGGLLLLGGRLGDTFGRRRVLVAGVLVFTAASAIGGIAPSAAWLVLARVLQGVGAALAAPATLSLIVTNFEEGPDRNRALGWFSSIGGVGASLGLILGGMLTSWLSWHWVFFVNVPVGLAIAVLAPLAVRESPRRRSRFDMAGALASTAGITSLVYGMVRAAERGWSDTLTVSALVASVVLLGSFVMIERRVAQPIVPLRLLASRHRGMAFLNMLLVPSMMFGVFFFLTQYLQRVLEMSSLQTGFAFVPLSAGIVTVSRLTPALVGRFGAKAVMTVGGIVVVAAMTWLTRISPDWTYAPDVLFPLVLLGLGLGSIFVPLTVLIMGDLDPDDAGAASGLMQTANQVGGAIGLATLVTVFGRTNRNALAEGLDPIVAFTDGVRAGVSTAAVIGVAILAVTVFGIQRKRV